MQPPPPPRLHWIPVEPSWIVAAGLIILAALPHKVPATGRYILRHPVGAVLFAGLSIAVTMKVPVLGVAMLLFLAGVWFMRTSRVETFTPTVLNKDQVQTSVKKSSQRARNRWFEEEVLSEDPLAVQERTDNPTLTYDEVEGSGQWWAEEVLDETPLAIQERGVSTEADSDDHHH